MKICIRCKETKPLEEFSIHKKMADGHINKCKTCCVEYIKNYRLAIGKERLSEDRKKEYEKAIQKGSRSRRRSLEEIRANADPLTKKFISNRYTHKKRANPKNYNELDDLVFEEAIRLCRDRALIFGGEWQIDHPVPIKGKSVCGLHNAFNMQVVPRRWNELKSNVRIDYFLPTYMGPK